jgi:tRNA dimethylallyltransferase
LGNHKQQSKRLVVLVGPTAVGKTEISLALAERLHGEIVSADSRLFYRGMDIGTAKPTQAERDRVVHHLIDVAEPDEVWSLAVFQKAARRAITSIQDRGNLPFLVGGTGQYILAVTQEWDLPKVLPDPTMRDVLERWAVEISPQGLHDRLAMLDFPAAERIDPNNVRRTIRAMEVIFKTGKRFSDQRRRKPSPYNLLKVGLNRPREELYQRIDQRIENMLDQGLIEEVRGLLNRGYARDLPSMSAIGYKEIIQYLEGELTLDEAILQIKRKTRIFVRRQANWFKTGDPSIHWFDIQPGVVGIIEKSIKDYWANREFVDER